MFEMESVIRSWGKIYNIISDLRNFEVIRNDVYRYYVQIPNSREIELDDLQNLLIFFN